MRQIAAFDFDGTLTLGDTFFAFLRHVVGKPTFILGIIRLLPHLIIHVAGFSSNQTIKEKTLTHFLKGMSLDELSLQGKAFAEDVLPHLLRDAALKRLAWHQQQEHECILVSATLDIYLIPWARNRNFKAILSSSLEIDANARVTGKLANGNCHALEKAKRLQALLGDSNTYTLYAYGDSKGDKEMLALAQHAYFRVFPE